MEEREREQWEARRQAAARAREWVEVGPDLPCVRQPLVFALADDYAEAAKQAKRICNTACPHQELCLEQTLRMEVGLRAFQRSGIAAGLTGAQRAKVAQLKGCAVCGAKLAEEGSRLYCADHGIRGARARAVARGGAA